MANAACQVASNDNHTNCTDPYKLLGFVHNPSTDALSIKHVQLDDSVTSKRELLSQISQVFDPTGFLLPITSSGKLLLRRVNLLNLGWDDRLPPHILSAWKKFATEVGKGGESFQIPREAYSNQSSIGLQVFSDASKELTGSVIYITQNEQANFLFAKNRLTPKIQRTIPTLELLSFANSVKLILKILQGEQFAKILVNKINFFSDSQVAITWILNKVAPKRNKFAVNRMKEINAGLSALHSKGIRVDINFVSTVDNVADLVTRPISASKFFQSKEFYYHGPKWLKTEEIPRSNLNSVPTRFIAPDKKFIYALGATTIENSIIDIARFSSYNKLLNTTAYVLLFIDKIAKKPIRNFVSYRTAAFDVLISQMQRNYFPVESNYLNKPMTPGMPPALVLKLRLYKDENGLIRSKGRVASGQVFSPDAQNPWLVSGRSTLAKLLIIDAHEKAKHTRVNSTLYQLRNSGIWLTSPRAAVAKTLKNCLICRNFDASNFSKPPAPELPTSRTAHLVPFTSVGMDYTGAFTVRDFSGNKIKVYILLFTCMTTRAIHLEVVPDMTVCEFIRAFVRFTSLFGIPQQVWSDNARTLVAGGDLLRKVLTNDSITEHFTNRNIVFKTIPVYCPNQGGAWERMVGVVKRVLTKVYGRYTFAYSEFQTVVAETQNTINNRPLLYVQNDNDTISPNLLLFTRSHFPSLKLSESNMQQVYDHANDRKFLSALFQDFRQQKVVNAEFLSTWIKSYILELRSQHGLSNSTEPNLALLQPGVVCLWQLPNVKHYPLVRILNLLPSHDGTVRNVRIIKADKSKIVVGINTLAPLELSAEPIANSLCNEQPAEVVSQLPGSRPQREAALGQRRKLRRLMLQGDL